MVHRSYLVGLLLELLGLLDGVLGSVHEVDLGEVLQQYMSGHMAFAAGDLQGAVPTH